VDIEGVEATLLSDALQSIGLGESVPVRVKVWLRKKTMDLCACESEEHEPGVGAGANTTLLSDTLFVYYVR
jgi:hypothetical protein